MHHYISIINVISTETKMLEYNYLRKNSIRTLNPEQN